jgi:hypothetical protein
MVDVTTSQIVNDAINWAVFVGGAFGVSKTRIGAKVLAFLLKEKGVITQGVDELIHSPAGKVVEAELHHKLNKVADDLTQTQLGKVSAEVLHGVGIALGSLSEDQRKAVILLISTQLPSVSKGAIEKALAETQKIADAIQQNPLIQSANKFTQEQLAASAQA